MAYPAFTQIGSLTIAASPTSVATAIPSSGSPSVVLVSNPSSDLIFVALGTTSGVIASPTTGACVLPGIQLPMVIGANTFFAVVTLSRVSEAHFAFGS